MPRFQNPLSRTLLPHLVLTAACILTGCQSGPTVNSADLDRLTGPEWKGTLTYRDYQTGKETSIESTLEVVKLAGLAQVGNDFADAGVSPSWEFRFGYPHEPKADSINVLKISQGGRLLDGAIVTERLVISGGALRLVTEGNGTDNDNPARFRHFYTITDNAFTITKLVKPAGTDDFFERNTYRWAR